MARRKKGTPVHGWLALDKPCGLTSTAAVGAAKRLFDAAKAGHAGTLDPLASGVLPIAFGEATKTVSYIVDGAKSYRFTVRWGVETDTDDAEGKVIQESDGRPARDEVEAALAAFTGEIMQIPPSYSAIKVEGARAYDLARGGEEFDIAARPVVIDRLEIAEIPDADTCVLEADCGKGTYVRALARDLGRALGCFGHVDALRRTRVGPFNDTGTISLDKLKEIGHSAAGREGLLQVLEPVETALDDIPALAVSGDDAARLKRGQAVLLRGRDAPILKGPVYTTSRGMLVALGEVRHGEIRPKRVFNIQG
ncbi:MAG: tRNA pseudouridine(55) synthase TruB [Hyphomicrobiales bacterium]|nr:tRNA pseudouridine(55) synthase TruB [Hyphomicrobiales bacterium]